MHTSFPACPAWLRRTEINRAAPARCKIDSFDANHQLCARPARRSGVATRAAASRRPPSRQRAARQRVSPGARPLGAARATRAQHTSHCRVTINGLRFGGATRSLAFLFFCHQALVGAWLKNNKNCKKSLFCLSVCLINAYREVDLMKQIEMMQTQQHKKPPAPIPTHTNLGAPSGKAHHTANLPRQQFVVRRHRHLRRPGGACGW